MLSTSSLLFHVLSARILSRPMIIWEEYRLHAIVFSLRSLSVYIFGIYRPFQGTLYENLTLGLIVAIHHLIVDEITRRYGSSDKSSTTVRVKDNGNIFVTFVLRFYAFYQFSALASYLTPNDRLCDLGYNALIAIQSSAFLMTLYRKSIISYRAHAIWYTLCLIISIYHIFNNCMRTNTLFIIKLSFVYCMRLKYGISKYILWCIFLIMGLPIINNYIHEQYYNYTSRILNDESLYVSIIMIIIGLTVLGFNTIKEMLSSSHKEEYITLLKTELMNLFPFLSHVKSSTKSNNKHSKEL
jgi:hypothetical protein